MILCPVDSKLYTPWMMVVLVVCENEKRNMRISLGDVLLNFFIFVKKVFYLLKSQTTVDIVIRVHCHFS